MLDYKFKLFMYIKQSNLLKLLLNSLKLIQTRNLLPRKFKSESYTLTWFRSSKSTEWGFKKYFESFILETASEKLQRIIAE